MRLEPLREPVRLLHSPPGAFASFFRMRRSILSRKNTLSLSPCCIRRSTRSDGRHVLATANNLYGLLVFMESADRGPIAANGFRKPALLPPLPSAGPTSFTISAPLRLSHASQRTDASQLHVEGIAA